MRLSVILPVLDEAERITQRLEELDRLAGVHDIVVVDGGSSDGTRDLAACAELETPLAVLEAPRGRGRQMNAGARVAAGDVLLFLHADCQLPAEASQRIAGALADSRVVAGAFRTWTVDDRPDARPAPWLHLADLRSRYSRLPYGDQAIFVRRRAFEYVGGYPDQPLMEDLELSRRLRRVGRIQIVKAQVQVSGRRFLASPVTDTLLINTFPLLYRAGVSAQTLARMYRNFR